MEVRGAGTRWEDRVIAWLNAPALRRASRRAVRVLVSQRQRRVARSLAAAAWRWLVKPGSCCVEGSGHHRFVSRYSALLAESRALDALARHLGEGELARVSDRIEALARITVLGMLRHAALGRRGASPRLMEAQIAPYPECDLACRGCYALSDHHPGRAPDRAGLGFLVDEAARCGALAIHVVGKGEPFLTRDQTEDLLAVIDERPHLLFVVATHAMRIDEATARGLGALPNLILLVSVDGPEAVHDRRRGAGAHAALRAAQARLRRHGVLFGFATMVGRHNLHEVVRREFVLGEVRAGCALGVYSRYFPLGERADELLLSADEVASELAAIEQIRRDLPVPIFDLDELETHTGCRARSGCSIYIDGVSGQVAPCIRVPFSPPGCRIGPGSGPGLAQVLAHPFFEAHRRAERPACGADLAAELDQLAEELRPHAPLPAALAAYRRNLDVNRRAVPRHDHGGLDA